MSRPHKLLILDDDRAIRESFIFYFEDQGWNIWSEDTAENALARLKEESPEAAIVDIRLPGMNGEDFIQKASKALPQMSFVICTGSPEYEENRGDLNIPGLSKRIFYKPISHMEELEKELLKRIEK